MRRAAGMSAVTTAAPAARIARERPDAWGFVMVAVAGLMSALVLVLLAIVLWLSVIDGQPGDPDLGYTLANYTDIFTDRFTYRVLYNTFVFSGVTLVVAMATGAPIAWLVERTDFPGKTLVMTAMTVGLLLPGFATAIGWEFLLHPRIGMVNAWLMSLFGLTEAPFNIGTLWGMGWVQGLGLAPVAFVMISVVFRSMDSALEEASTISGATPRQTMMRVTVPLAWPGNPRRRHLYLHDRLRRLRRAGDHRPGRQSLHLRNLRLRPGAPGAEPAAIRHGLGAVDRDGRARDSRSRGGTRACSAARRNTR